MREHRCLFVAHRDHNAAINIQKKGTDSPFRDGSGDAPARTENLPGPDGEAAAL